MVAQMQKDKDVTWVAYYCEYSKASQLVRVRKRSGKPKKKNAKKARCIEVVTNAVIASTNAYRTQEW